MTEAGSISVIVPIYNEIALLESSLKSIVDFVGRHFADYEIILIESGSTDGSLEACRKLAASNPRIKLLCEGQRKGFGSAVKLGYANATKDWVWLVTVDFPFPLEAMEQALPLLPKYDCVLSYRPQDNRSVFRRLQSLVYNKVAKTALGLKVRHVNSAFKVLRRPLVQSLTIKSNGWLIDAEILYRLKQKGVAYAEIPVPFLDRPRGKSTVKLTTALSVLRELFWLLRHREE